jgi:hypothetical protein
MLRLNNPHVEGMTQSIPDTKTGDVIIQYRRKGIHERVFDKSECEYVVI